MVVLGEEDIKHNFSHIFLNRCAPPPSNSSLIQEALIHDKPVEDVLHVVTVISNVCEFKRRWNLMKDFIQKIEKTPSVKLYIVELAYDEQDFHITQKDNPTHLQLRCEYALWHKENMINLGIQKLLPSDWKAVAWIDGDIEFDHPSWALDCLKILNRFDMVQLFTTCMDLNENEVPMSLWQSFGYKYAHGQPFQHLKGLNYWHTGYGWACTREFYEKIGGLYDKGILGSGDYIMCQAMFGKAAFISQELKGFKTSIEEYIRNYNGDLKIGYIPTNIKHFFHGSKTNRKYLERNNILLKHGFDPFVHLKYDSQGVLVPTEKMSNEFLQDILTYFSQRNEDEFHF
jgi:hypothetical protein